MEIYETQFDIDTSGTPYPIRTRPISETTTNVAEEFRRRYSFSPFDESIYRYTPANILAELEKYQRKRKAMERDLTELWRNVIKIEDPPKASPGSSVVAFSKFLEGKE